MSSDPTTSDASVQSIRWKEWVLVLLSFAVFASLRSPVPGVNEPHYLTKARHFWDASFCSRDPFLQSSNAHYVFYATIGAFTRVGSLEQAACAGRVIGWLLLSSAWTVLAARLLPFRWGAVWSAWVFLWLAALGNWSGEWVVGGIEAKVLSYGCGWWSLACALSGKPVYAAAWSGAAVSFHPVVGIWNTAAVVIALFLDDWRPWRVFQKWTWKQWGACGLAWTILALPGLIPAVSMLRGADKAQSYQADYIQVFHRLSHHLDPWRFAVSGYWCYAALLLFSVIVYCLLPRNARWNMAARYVGVAVLIALGGVMIRGLPDMAAAVKKAGLLPGADGWLEKWIAYKPHLAGLLKFYPFRLADVAVPWGSALLIVLVVNALLRFLFMRKSQTAPGPQTPIQWSIVTQALAWLVFGGCFVTSLLLPAQDRNPSRLTPEFYADWVDACHWLDRETPRDAMCYASNEGWALKWFAHRADYLSHKDCPQDAPGIVAWNDRFKMLAKWSNRYAADGYSAAELRELRKLTGIDYLVARRFGPIHLTPVYRNRDYSVYLLPK